MVERTDRAASVAATLERVAAALRAGDARLYGYRIQREPRERERGAISYADGWVEFAVERPDGWFAPDGDERAE